MASVSRSLHPIVAEQSFNSGLSLMRVKIMRQDRLILQSVEFKAEGSGEDEDSVWIFDFGKP